MRTPSAREDADLRICEKRWIAFWAYSDAWERAASNEEQLLSAETDEAWVLIQRAAETDDATSAFCLCLEAAEAGSVWSLGRVGWSYWTGTGVAADPQLALNYYHRAIAGGSWMATICFARILAEQGLHEDCEQTLESGVACGFVPSYFWLAWHRYRRSPTPETCREVRPLLDHAAEQGHPEAKLLLAGWMARGKFGLREIPRGWWLAMRAIQSFASSHEQSAVS